jgi:hypothetical protein
MVESWDPPKFASSLPPWSPRHPNRSAANATKMATPTWVPQGRKENPNHSNATSPRPSGSYHRLAAQSTHPSSLDNVSNACPRPPREASFALSATRLSAWESADLERNARSTTTSHPSMERKPKSMHSTKPHTTDGVGTHLYNFHQRSLQKLTSKQITY